MCFVLLMHFAILNILDLMHIKYKDKTRHIRLKIQRHYSTCIAYAKKV